MIDVRRAGPDDLDAVITLEARLFGAAAWSPRAVEEEFQQIGQSRSIVVAGDGDKVVGYAVLLHVADTADVQRIAVQEGHQRRGIASALLTALLEQASGLGCLHVLLEVAEDNNAALKLYAGKGFEQIDRRHRYYPDGRDAIVMRRTLGATPTRSTPTWSQP